jgi:hypothetical protein
MGYLDNSSITVDAILTKHGRYKLSLGGGLDIQHFALADDGMDYSLWNPLHPSGSDSYGEAITALPQIEAVPDDIALMRYKLWHADRDLEYWPVIRQVEDLSFSNTKDYKDIIPETEQFGNESYIFKFTNSNIIRFHSPKEEAGIVVGSTDLRFPLRTNIPLSKEFRGFKQLRIYAKSLDLLGSTTVHITGQSSGATTSISITVNPTRSA